MGTACSPGGTYNTECTDENVGRRGVARHHLSNEICRHADDGKEGQGLEHADYFEGRPKSSIVRSGHLVEGLIMWVGDEGIEALERSMMTFKVPPEKQSRSSRLRKRMEVLEVLKECRKEITEKKTAEEKTLRKFDSR